LCLRLLSLLVLDLLTRGLEVLEMLLLVLLHVLEQQLLVLLHVPHKLLLLRLRCISRPLSRRSRCCRHAVGAQTSQKSGLGRWEAKPGHGHGMLRGSR
jgi:hypothetical protein